jgi:hypothetical protein
VTYEHRSRPKAAPGVAADSIVPHPSDVRAGVDLAALSREQMDVWLSGYSSGFEFGLDRGYERGRDAEREEVAALQRRAVAVVHGLASVPPWGTRADRMARMERAAERVAAELEEIRREMSSSRSSRRSA